MTNQKMTKEQAFRLAKMRMLGSMINNFSAEVIPKRVAVFGAEEDDSNAIVRLDWIAESLDSLIENLNKMKKDVNIAKSMIKDAE